MDLPQRIIDLPHLLRHANTVLPSRLAMVTARIRAPEKTPSTNFTFLMLSLT